MALYLSERRRACQRRYRCHTPVNKRRYGWVMRPALAGVLVHRRKAIQPWDIWIVAHIGDQRIFSGVVARPYRASHLCVGFISPRSSLLDLISMKLRMVFPPDHAHRGGWGTQAW